MTTPDQDAPDGQQAPPTCFRHPDRETWVSCVRCGRHACPDCLRQAAVGQQCVECVRGGAQGTRPARTAFGGRPVANAAVTWTLVGINVVLFLVMYAAPNLANNWELLGYARFSSGGPRVPADPVRVPASDRRPRLPRHPVQHVGARRGGTRP